MQKSCSARLGSLSDAWRKRQQRVGRATNRARAIAERKTVGDLSWRVATRLQSLSLPDSLSIRLRRL
ncbi:MAG: hypothetical protein ACI9ND_001198 [Yoonia sp.]|jgi:hypothetical protein